MGIGLKINQNNLNLEINNNKLLLFHTFAYSPNTSIPQESTYFSHSKLFILLMNNNYQKNQKHIHEKIPTKIQSTTKSIKKEAIIYLITLSASEDLLPASLHKIRYKPTEVFILAIFGECQLMLELIFLPLNCKL